MINESDVPGAINSPPPPSLEYVSLFNDDPYNDILEWLVSREHVSIETLKLVSIQEDKIRTIAHCLRRMGPSLKNLEVSFRGHSPAYIRCQGSGFESIAPDTFHLH